MIVSFHEKVEKKDCFFYYKDASCDKMVEVGSITINFSEMVKMSNVKEGCT